VRRLFACALAVIAISGCGDNGSNKGEQKGSAGKFGSPTRIGNPFLPLHPGTKFVLVGKIKEGGKRVPHRVEFLVTDLTKVVHGVRTRVVWDRDYDNGRLVEGELAFFAQDDAGNVWSYGEYPEEWEGRKLAGAPSTWIPGVQGAKPGIMMKGAPRAGTPEYSQGLAPAIDFRDRARVKATGQRTCVPTGCYSGVLVTEERSPDEPNARQLKYYAPTVGNVRVGFTGEGQDEGLVLQRVVQLTAAERKRAAAGALALDRRAYCIARKVYGATPRAVAG
jgi:hypothetical protein